MSCLLHAAAGSSKRARGDKAARRQPSKNNTRDAAHVPGNHKRAEPLLPVFLVPPRKLQIEPFLRLYEDRVSNVC